MTNSNLVRESIIKGYLNGKSYDELAYENDIAKGSVSNVINAWIDKIGIPDIYEIRDFSIMLRKSGITIKQCVQSFRFIQILSNFGITDELDSSYIPDISRSTYEKEEKSLIKKNKIGERKKDNSPTLRTNFYYFIESIYNNCKKNRIQSTNVIEWIHDLLEFDPSLTENSNDVSYGFEQDIDEPKMSQKSEMIKKSQSWESEDKLIDREIQVPLVSKINSYIRQKKSNIQNLDFHSKQLQQEIRYLEGQKNMLCSRITNLKRKESISLTYLDWYNSLKQELFDLFRIKLEEEVSSFVNMFNDFKYYDYNLHQIVKEYKQIESLRDEKDAIQGIVESIEKTRDELLRKIESLEERENYSRQSLDILLELRHAGFGFKELRQLKNTVIEISIANNISWFDAGRKFVKDIERQYDDKLGFETKINEIKVELKNLEYEVPGYKERLQSQVNAFGVLQYLYKFGVTDDDIINMSHIVTAYLNGNITFDPNLQSGSLVDENKLIKKVYYWKSFINEIRNLGDINSQIRKQGSVLESIKKEIDVLNSQRQKLNDQTLLSGQILNSLFGRLGYFVETLKQIMTAVQQLNKVFILSQSHFLICVVITSRNSKNGNDNLNEQEDE